MMPIRQQLKKWKQDDCGSFTLEATILFPIILMLIILFILFSLVIYEKVTLQYQANRIVSQLAHSWGSSTMDVQTGAMGINDYVTKNGDGLYWRAKEFEIAGFRIDDGLVQSKIDRIGEVNGNVNINKGFFNNEIEVELEKQLPLPPVVADIFGLNSVAASASHPIVDPVETIRTTDFMIYGYHKLSDYSKYIRKFAE